MTYEIVRYAPALRAGVNALLTHVTGEGELANDAYFRWKHEENPYVDGPLAYVALCDGRVVGMRAFLGALWRDTDGVHAWPCACDLVVDPDHRGQGLVQRIMDFALADLAARGFRTIVNLSANPITYHLSLRSGWRLVVPNVTWTRETAHALRMRRWSQRLRRWPLLWRVADAPHALPRHRGFDALDARWLAHADATPITLASTPRPEAMAALVDATRAPLRSHVRDASYYRWRLRNPICDYRFVFHDDPALAGFLVLQRSRRVVAADLNIVDHAAANVDILAGMLARIVDNGGFDRLSMWVTSLPAASTQRLAALGFTPSDTTRGDPAYRPGLLSIDAAAHSGGVPPVPEPEPARSPSWDLRMLDSDFY